MKGFLDIEAVANLTGYTVDEIKLLASNGMIPNNAWPDGRILFPIADTEKWIKTHKKAIAPKAIPPAAKAAEWPPEETHVTVKKAALVVPFKDDVPGAPAASDPAKPAELPKVTKAPRVAKGAKSAKK
jgi:hypothetical protein